MSAPDPGLELTLMKALARLAATVRRWPPPAAGALAKT